MTHTKETLKLALEALHGFIPYLPLADDDQCEKYDKAITAIEPALAQPAVPEGWKLVPIEPTDEMLDAAQSRVDDMYRVDAMNSYEAMIKAAPAHGITKGQP
jgi:hypothetical protein